VTGALQTPDGAWRVEIVHRSGNEFFRLIHRDNIIDGLTITTVEQLLAQAGADMTDLTEAPEIAGETEPGTA
jgi:bifunctional non-homologous end joining protein LigD